jgi:glycerate-2-kinase
MKVPSQRPQPLEPLGGDVLGVAKRLRQLLEALPAEGVEDLVLAAEIDIDTGLRDPDPGRQLAGGETLVTLGDEQRLGRRQDFAAALVSLATGLAVAGGQGGRGVGHRADLISNRRSWPSSPRPK